MQNRSGAQFSIVMINAGSYFRLRTGDSVSGDVPDKSLNTCGSYFMITLNKWRLLNVEILLTIFDIVYVFKTQHEKLGAWFD